MAMAIVLFLAALQEDKMLSNDLLNALSDFTQNYGEM